MRTCTAEFVFGKLTMYFPRRFAYSYEELVRRARVLMPLLLRTAPKRSFVGTC